MPYGENGEEGNSPYEIMDENLFAYDGDGETRLAQYRRPMMHDFDRMRDIDRMHDFNMHYYDRRDFDRGDDRDQHIHHHHHHYHHFNRGFEDIFPFLFFF